jgi:hypothetical protein
MASSVRRAAGGKEGLAVLEPGTIDERSADAVTMVDAAGACHLDGGTKDGAAVSSDTTVVP